MNTLMVKAERLWSSFLAPARISRPGTHSARRFMRARYVLRAVAVIGIDDGVALEGAEGSLGGPWRSVKSVRTERRRLLGFQETPYMYSWPNPQFKEFK